jgi:hypothetical protein
MGIVYLPTLGYYFYGDIRTCTIASQVMTLKLFKNIGHYLHLSDEECRPGPTDIIMTFSARQDQLYIS